VVSYGKVGYGEVRCGMVRLFFNIFGRPGGNWKAG